MAGPNRNRSGDKAVAFFASAFVLAGGVVFCSVILLVFAPDPTKLFAIGGGILLGLLLLVWLVYDHSDGRSLMDRYGFLFGVKNKKEKVKVKVKRVKHEDFNRPKGPPTAGDIRELAEGTNTWVPSDRRRDSED